jgi:hypothetical protein
MIELPKGPLMTITDTVPASGPLQTKTTRAARDPRTFWRVLIAIALPIGPLLVTAARALLPYWTNQDSETIARNILAHPGRMELLGWLGLPIVPLMLTTVLALGWVARRGAPVLAALGAIPSFLAYGMWD